MGQGDLQKRLDHSMYGTPLVKPDEQREYMGTFRERCYATMTIGQMAQTEQKINLVSELKKHPDAFILLNGSINDTLQASYLKLLTEHGTKFTIINDNVTNQPESLGLILASKEAVNQQVVDIEEKYPKQVIPPKQPTKKSFWGKLFH